MTPMKKIKIKMKLKVKIMVRRRENANGNTKILYRILEIKSRISENFENKRSKFNFN